jgi:hypothetical protein
VKTNHPKFSDLYKKYIYPKVYHELLFAALLLL